MEDLFSSLSLKEAEDVDPKARPSTKDSSSQPYKPLDVIRREIRLLHIQPRATNLQEGLLECILVTVSLEDEPEFDALSYTWGGDLVDIRLNYQNVKVTENLHAALSIFRDTGANTQYLWADALCINQADIEERGSQVQLMRDIYSRAQMVRIWLGGSIPEVELLFDVVLSGAEPMSIFEADWESLKGLNFILSKGWWMRLWIIQEAVLASNATLHCGPFRVPWKAFQRFAKRLWLMQSTPGKWTQDHRRQFDSQYTKNLTRASHVLDPSFAQGNPRNNKLMISRLRYIASSDVTDPRDRVYGALGLMPPTLGITPNYNLSKVEIYRDFTLRMMKTQSSLEILCLCNNESGETSGPGWVPPLKDDWHSINDAYEASGRASFYVQELSDDQLAVRGVIVDHILTVEEAISRYEMLPSVDGQSAGFGEELQKSRRRMTKANSESSETEAVAGANLWRTLSQITRPSIIGLNTRTASQVASNLEAELNEWADNEATIRTKLGQYLWEKDRVSTWVQTLAITKNGRKVLSRARPQPGDRIAILAGACQLLVLRPQPERSQNAYSILSICFCEGLMYGEHIREAAKRYEGSYLDSVENTFQRNYLAAILALHANPASVIRSVNKETIRSFLNLTIAVDMALPLEHSRLALDAKGLEIALQLYMAAYPHFVEFTEQNGLGYGETLMASAAAEALLQSSHIELTMAFTAFIFERILRGVKPLRSNQFTPPVLGGVSPESSEALLLISGLMIFKVLLHKEREKAGGEGFYSPEDLRSWTSVLDGLLASTETEKRVSECYESIRQLAKEEVALEGNIDSLFQEIVLV